MPPITFPGIGDVVLNSQGRQLFEASGLTGFSFQPVKKARIVHLPWEEWDRSADDPREYPDSGEPEDYILERPHDPGLAEAMGELWELLVPITAKVARPRKIVESFRELWVEHDSWNGADIFRGQGFGSPLVTERAKRWLETQVGTFTAFSELESR